jgi:hypothetical protein
MGGRPGCLAEKEKRVRVTQKEGARIEVKEKTKGKRRV